MTVTEEKSKITARGTTSRTAPPNTRGRKAISNAWVPLKNAFSEEEAFSSGSAVD